MTTQQQQQVDQSQAAHTNAHAAGMTQYLTHFRYPAVGEGGQRLLSPMDTCVTRGLVGGVMGGGMGVVFGMLMHMSGPMGGMGAMPQVPGVPNPQLNAPPPPPAAATANAPRTGINGAIGASASAASTAASSASVVATPALSGSSSSAASSSSGGSLLYRPSIGGLGPQPRPMPLGVPSSSGIGMADPIYGMSHTPELSSWTQVKAMARDTGRMAKGNFKTWGIMSANRKQQRSSKRYACTRFDENARHQQLL